MSTNEALPWRPAQALTGYRDDWDPDQWEAVIVSVTSNAAIATVQGKTEPEVDRRADLICRAVNSHDALVEALEKAQRAIREHEAALLNHDRWDGLHEADQEISAALALARGEASKS